MALNPISAVHENGLRLTGAYETPAAGDPCNPNRTIEKLLFPYTSFVLVMA